jgi:hypothetical protein
MIINQYPNEAYDEAWMEQEERYYTDVAYGESRLVPPWYPKIEPCCTADDYPDGTPRR